MQMRLSRVFPGLIVLWLLIGALAAGQRGYYSSSTTNCATGGKIVVTILAGPLNYVGVSPKTQCLLPQPSR